MYQYEAKIKHVSSEKHVQNKIEKAEKDPTSDVELISVFTDFVDHDNDKKDIYCWQ